MLAHVHFLLVGNERVVASLAQRLQLQVGFDRVETVDGEALLRHVVRVVLVQLGDDQSMFDEQLVDVHDVLVGEYQCTIETVHEDVEHVH